MEKYIVNAANKLVNDAPLSDLDLRQLIIILGLDTTDIPFIGIYRLNEIPESFYDEGSSGYIIINLDTKNDGTHWVAMIKYVDENGLDSIIYYDSFGMDIPKHILTDIAPLGHPIRLYASSVQQQRIDSNRCGWFILQFLLDMLYRRRDSTPLFDELRSLELYWLGTSKNEEKRTDILESRLLLEFLHIFDELL